MNESITPAEQELTETVIDNLEPVKDAEAVLRKNRELLQENAKLKTLAEKAKNFDFDKAVKALEEQQRAEEERLTRKGEYDKLIEQKTKAYEERLEAERRERTQMEVTLKNEKLANVLMEKGVLPDRVHYLVKEIADSVELAQGDTGFVLRKKGGIGDAAEFDTLVEDVRNKSPFFFAANIASGTGGSGSQATGSVSTKKWSELSRAEKTEAIRQANGDLALAQKKYK